MLHLRTASGKFCILEIIINFKLKSCNNWTIHFFRWAHDALNFQQLFCKRNYVTKYCKSCIIPCYSMRSQAACQQLNCSSFHEVTRPIPRYNPRRTFHTGGRTPALASLAGRRTFQFRSDPDPIQTHGGLAAPFLPRNYPFLTDVGPTWIVLKSSGFVPVSVIVKFHGLI